MFLIKPSTVLKEVKEYQSLQQKLRLRIRLGRRELLVFLKIGLYRFQRFVKAPEEVFCERFFVESLCPSRYPALCIGSCLPARQVLED